MHQSTQTKNNHGDAMSVIDGLLNRVKNQKNVQVLRERMEAVESYESLLQLICDAYRAVNEDFVNTVGSKFLVKIKDPFARAQLEKMLIYNKQIMEIMAHSIDKDNRYKGRGKGQGRLGKGHKKNGSEEVLALDKRYFLIYGKCQSGKTRFMQDIVFSHILINRCAAIIILRNSVGDSRQLQQRCDEYRQNCEEWMETNHPGVKGNGLSFVYANNNSKDEQLRTALSGKNPSLIIVIANTTQMTRLKEALKNVKKPRYVVAIDEADQVAYGEQSTSFRSILQENILPEAGRVYGVTATSFDMLFTEDKIDTASVILLEQRYNYKGLKNIELRCLDNKAVPGNKTHDWFDNDGNIIPVLSHLGQHDCRKNKTSQRFCSDPSYNPKHPTITIIKNTHLNYSQDKLLHHIAKHSDLTMWCGLIYNGQGVTIFHPESKQLQRMGGKSPCERKWAEGNLVKDSLFFKGVGINEGLEYLRQLDIILKEQGKSRVTHIAVIAGDLADRGISFVSSEYHWHPTSMYYVPATRASVSHIIQAAGRLCGNFDDSIPLQLFAPGETLEDLRKGINLQEDILTQVKSKTFSDRANVIEAIQDLPVSVEKVPERNLGHQAEGQEDVLFNLVEGQDGGADLTTYKKNPIRKMLEGKKKNKEKNKEKKEESKEDQPLKEIPHDEFIRLTMRMFPKWSKQDTKIARFMHNLDPRKTYSKKDFKTYCVEIGITDLAQVLNIRRGNGVGFGTIIKSINNTYQLYPELLNDFDKYF